MTQYLNYSNTGSEDELDFLASTRKKFSTKFGDILLDPATICSISWADSKQELLMCKVKAEADCSSFGLFIHCGRPSLEIWS
jgi:hypothetical protein